MPAVRFLSATYTETQTTSNTIKISSASLFTQGTRKQLGRTFAGNVTVGAYTGTEQSFATFKNRRVFKGKGNNTEIEPKIITVTNSGTKTAIVRLYKNGTRTGSFNYQSSNDNSALLLDTVNTSLPTGGILLASYVIGAGTSSELNISVLNIVQHANEVYTFTQDSNNQNSINLDMAITWYEDQ